MLIDQVPGWLAAVTPPTVAVFLLLENKQARGRLLISTIKKYLGVGHA